MKILIDENIDVNFKKDLFEFETKTVRDNNWVGIKNGELLKLAVNNGYDVFVTLDSNIRHQQNLSKLEITIFVLKSMDSRLSNLKLFIPQIKNLLKSKIESEKPGIIEISL